MRTLPVAIAVSVALHGAAIAYVKTRPRPKPEPAPKVTTIEIVQPAVPAEPEPMVVALLDDHTPVKAMPLSGVSDGLKEAKASPAKHSISNGSSRGGGEVPAGPPAAHNPLMGMRGKNEGPGLVWNPSSGFDAAFQAYSDAHPPQVAPPPTGELHESGGGTFKSDQPAFKVKVARDGTAHIEDKPDFDIHFGLIGIYGKANFDDWAMRKEGIDPYASAKRQWLDKTRDERARIAMANRTEDLARAPELMRRNLAWAWNKTANDPEARKQALFELWDECAETGDDDLVAAGTAARAYVVGFIRAHLGPDEPGSFTGDDLARMNAHRRSKATFQPY